MKILHSYTQWWKPHISQGGQSDIFRRKNYIMFMYIDRSLHLPFWGRETVSARFLTQEKKNQKSAKRKNIMMEVLKTEKQRH